MAAPIQSLLRLLLSKVDKQKGDPDCFVQIQGWRRRLKTLSFSPIGFLGNLLLYKYFLCLYLSKHLPPRVLHCPKTM